ncbi:MAG: hypothetical protein WA477_02620 [Candidatus Sulfotelmatobacter sp.]
MTQTDHKKIPPNQTNDPSDDQLDRLLDAFLTKYATVEPRLGLEERVLASLCAQPKTASASTWWRWGLAGALAAIIAIASAPAWRSGTTSHPVLLNRPAETQPAPTLAPQTANARAETVPARVPPVRKQNRQKISTKLATDPKLDVFPSPRPLSEEELALARYVRNFPTDAQQVAQAQEASAREVLARMQALAHESTESN